MNDANDTTLAARAATQNPNASSNSGDSSDDTSNRYLSFEVIPPSDSSDGTHTYNYFRMGEPNKNLEGTLPPDPNDTEAKGNGQSPWKDGMVTYSSGSYQQKVKAAHTWASETLNVLSDGHVLVTANYSSASKIPGLGAPQTINYQSLDQFNVNAGFTLTAASGIQQQFWNVALTQLGVGSWMKGAVGSIIDVTAGQTIKLGLGYSKIEGLESAETAKQHTVNTTGPIRFSSNPSSAALESWRQTFRKWVKVAGRVAAIFTATAPGLMSAAVAGQDFGSWIADDSLDGLKKKLTITKDELTAIAATTLVIQAGIALSAKLWQAGKPAAVEEDIDSPTGVSLWLDAETPGANRVHLKSGSRKLVFDATGSIVISNGNGAASIAITGSSIILSAGASSIVVDDSGITLGAPDVKMDPINAGAYSLAAALNGGIVVAQQAEVAAAAADYMDEQADYLASLGQIQV